MQRFSILSPCACENVSTGVWGENALASSVSFMKFQSVLIMVCSPRPGMISER